MNTIRATAAVSFLIGSVVILQRAGAVDPPAKADAPLRPLSIRALAYSSDGKLLLAAAGMKAQTGLVVAWDAETRKELWRYRSAKGFPALSFAPDGKSIAVTNWKTSAISLDATTGRERGEIGPHVKTVRAAVYIPDTDFLATGSDGTIRLWNVKTGKVEKELKGGHPAEVNSLVASPNGKWLISTGPDATRFWDVAAGTELKDVFKNSPRFGFNGIVFTAPDHVLMSNNSAVQRITELPSGKEVLHYENSGGYANQAYSAVAGMGAYCWPEATEAAIAELTFRSPTADESAMIGKLLKDFDGDSYSVRVAASAEMRKIGSVAEPALRKAMTGGPSAEVKMRARETRKAILNEPLRRLVGHTGAINAMVFSPDGKVLASGADDSTVRLWDPQTGKELARLDVLEIITKP